MPCAFMPAQLIGNVASCVLTPSLTRAIPKESPPWVLALAQSMLEPSYTDTSAPCARGPPTGPLGSGRGAMAVPVVPPLEEPLPVVDPLPVVEPVVEPLPVVAPDPVVDPLPVGEPDPVVVPLPVVDPDPVVDPVPVVEPLPVVEPEPV